MISIVSYEELPEGLMVMLREDAGAMVIVIDSRLSRVERLRARKAGKEMLRHRRRAAVASIGMAGGEWGQRLREWAPVCRAPAAIAGGALAMTMVAGSDVLPGERLLPPGRVAQGPAITAERMAAPHAFTPAERRPRPSGESLASARLTAPGPQSSNRPADPRGEASSGRAPTPKATASKRPAAEETREVPVVREKVRGRVPVTVRSTLVPQPPVLPETASKVPAPKVPAPKTRLPDTSPPPVDTPKPKRTPGVSLPEVPADLPTRVPSSLPGKPDGVGGKCGGLGDVKGKPLPRPCVGG
ncbi:hypothetical protein ACQEVF_32710 [Nonomuraea polychroma]|uniref:hypothetical protein n=1 Tax=Nonomuraea polychroma TaxID=46176 RepID=UPI003D8BA0D2